jgi:nucleotide-binding universal stress UspA family protein
MARLKEILCPVDFSASSRHALHRAAAVARAQGAALTVVHVCGAPVGTAAGVPFGPEGPGPFILHDLDRENASEQMRHLLDAVPAGVPVRHEVIEAASVYRAVLAEADKTAADLIVMGTHGRSGFDRWLLGSVTEKVLRRASVPVLTVPALAPDVAPDSTATFRRVLCAIDFSDCSRTALDYAASFARDANGTLILFHSVELLPIIYEPTAVGAPPFERDRPELERSAREHLRRLVPESLRQGITVEEAVGSGKPYVEILRLAEERTVDLIVLGVHGHGVIDRLIFGSTAGHVVRQAACPVLTVRQREQKEQ